MLGLYSLGSTWPLTIHAAPYRFRGDTRGPICGAAKAASCRRDCCGREGASRLTRLWFLAGCRQLPFSLMILTVIFWNTLRCSTTNRNQNLDCCCRGVNGSPAGTKAKRNLANKETSCGQVPIRLLASDWSVSAGAFVGTNPTGELITSGLPMIRAQCTAYIFRLQWKFSTSMMSLSRASTRV